VHITVADSGAVARASGNDVVLDALLRRLHTEPHVVAAVLSAGG
jgi:hypothetical protein